LYCAPIGKAFNMLKLADYLEEPFLLPECNYVYCKTLFFAAC